MRYVPVLGTQKLQNKRNCVCTRICLFFRYKQFKLHYIVTYSIIYLYMRACVCKPNAVFNNRKKIFCDKLCITY